MKNRWEAGFLVTTLMLVLAGCGGSVSHSATSNKSSANSKQSASTAKAAKDKSSESKALAKAAKLARGKQYRYILPAGPTWADAYVEGKDTGVALDPDQIKVAKLYENQKVAYGGPLPLVGTVLSAANPPRNNTMSLTIDQAKVADNKLDGSLFSSSTSGMAGFEPISGKVDTAIAKRGFADIKQYIIANNAADTSKLPNQTQALKTSLEEDMDVLGHPNATYQLQKLAFNQHSIVDPNDFNDYDHSTYVTVSHIDNTVATMLTVQIWTQALKTSLDTETNANETHAAITEYQLHYQLQDAQWVLMTVNNQGSSQYAQKMTGKHWITETPELFTRNSKIPIKHMIQVLDGDFTFSPFKCRKRASALV